MVRDDWDEWHMLQADFDLYLDKVETARREHPNLIIKVALEMDFIPARKIGSGSSPRDILGII
jgi:hypothetical protein